MVYGLVSLAGVACVVVCGLGFVLLRLVVSMYGILLLVLGFGLVASEFCLVCGFGYASLLFAWFATTCVWLALTVVGVGVVWLCLLIVLFSFYLFLYVFCL